MKYMPRMNWVTVKLLSQEKTAGGILLPEASKEDRLARVIDVGPGEWHHDGQLKRPAPEVKPGDLVMITHSGNSKMFQERWVGHRKDNILLVMNEEIVAVCTEEPLITA